MESPVDKALIRKFIDGGCTPEEMARIRLFLEQPGSDALFEELLNERWTESEEAPAEEAQLQEWERKFSRKVADLAPPSAKRFPLPSYFARAAVWAALVVSAAGYGWYQWRKGSTPATIAMLETSTKAGKLLKLQLPDSSVVYLNAASRLQYPEKFSGNNRTVILEGEAFFDIKQDIAHPFVVTTHHLDIKVLGTSFNVRSYDNDEAAAVTVLTGKVGVTAPASADTLMHIISPDNELTYTKAGGELQMMAVNAADSKAWEAGAFVFNYETLENITKRLSRWYDVEFVCTNRTLLDKRFKLKLQNEQLKNVLEALSTSGKGFHYEIKGKQVIIR